MLNQCLQCLKAVDGFVQGLHVEIHGHAAIIQRLVDFAFHQINGRKQLIPIALLAAKDAIAFHIAILGWIWI